MKKQLQKFLKLNAGRLFLLSMMLFIGQGLAFSQADIIVSTDADGGDGSLRQAVADAADGDIIGFDASLTALTLDSTLNLGDKTITIDGGGIIVLQRDQLALDTFRIVTIMGDSSQVITLKNLTIQNGLTKSEDGGGLYAEHGNVGHTVLENIIFQNNTAGGAGGGAYLTGFITDSTGSRIMVNNCTFENNLALNDDGGGVWADYTEFYGCDFTENSATDDGGGAWVTDGAYFENCTFTGNTGEDVGGAMRVQDRSVVIRGCTFDSNSSAGNAGAIMFARGEVYDSKFINNVSIGQGGAILANQNECIIDNCTFTGNSNSGRGGAVWVDDGGTVSNCIFTYNSGNVGGAVFVAGKKAPGIVVNSIFAYNTADSIGGAIHVAKADVINSTFTMNTAADNGGGLSGDGTYFIANSIFYGNTTAGADKDVQIVENSSDSIANCAVSVVPAAWNASGTIALTESPFVGGTEADSLMVSSASGLLDAGTTTDIANLIPDFDINGVKRVINGAIDLGPYEKYVTLVVTNADDSGAGSLRQVIADAVDGDNVITFADDVTAIKVDQPLELGDKTVIIDGGGDVVLDGAFNGDAGTDIYRVITVTGDSAKTVTIKNLTVQNGVAQGADGGGILADHSAQGITILDNLMFKDNTAVNGGGLSIMGYNADTACVVMNCEFTNNLATDGADEGDGGAFYAEYTMFSGCTVSNNQANDDGGAAFLSDGAEIYDSEFSGNTAGNVGGAFRIQDQSVLVSGSTFDSNTAPDQGGAIFMARGTILNSVFTANSCANGIGGAIYANQNECEIHGSHFSGNSAGTNGGAVYVDDGGVLSQCVITGNTATDLGGGVYLEGNNAPSGLIGSVVSNNTAAQGGGVYVENGNMVNNIITMNSAGTNGGALTGNGEWFMANTVVWGNDAAGADKNIEVVANSATIPAANCAIDATGYDAAAWTAAVDIATLVESPFIGGSEADSLHSASSKLVDAGTLEYGVADMLPQTDLDGESRFQGPVDMGAYETAIVSVLGVSLDKSVIDIVVGGTGTLTATVDPDFATDKQVTWSSSDESIATVEGGVVTGVAEGTATITVTTVDGGLTATSQANVTTAVTGVTLDQTEVTITVEETVTLVPTVAPANATNKTVGWTSGDEDIATVDGGVVTPVAPGTVTIMVTTMDGLFMATCEVTVTPAAVAVTGVSLDQSTATIDVDATVQLTATVAPQDADDTSVSWSSSDDAVATVNNSGLVTGVAEGTATITVTTTDGDFTATCEVTVNPVTSISSLSIKNFSVYPNPAQNNIFIDGDNIQSIALYSVTGVPVMIIEEGLSQGINISGIESGMYFLKVKTDKGTAVTTIMKE